MRRAAVRAQLLILLLALSAGCSRGPQTAGDARLGVFVSIPPQAYFVDRVGGERVRTEALVRPGQDAHTYDPTPRQVAGLARARVYFRIGFPFEKALIPRLESTVPELLIVDTRQGINLRPIEGEDDHGEQGGQDPHIWMSPTLVKRQVQTIRDSLIRLDPAGETEYRANAERFISDLERVRSRIAEALAPLRGRKLLVYHPAFGYFADEFGLKQVPVENAGKEPTSRQLARLIDLARTGGIKVVFVQPQLSQAGARAVAEAIGGAVMPLDDLAYDYINNLETMAGRIREALH
jgi:zinc transport system substrate-binding protein